MRKVIPLLVLATAIFAQLPQAHAASKVYRGSFKLTDAPVPCTMICAYQLDVSSVTGVDEPVQACEHPFPDTAGTPAADAGAPRVKSFSDYKLKIPVDANKWNSLELKVYPVVDWDSFICDGSGSHKELAQGAGNVAGEDCDSPMLGTTPVPAGCVESARIPVVPGHTYIMRGYNFGDNADCPFTITLKHVT